jgi:hypothetical protein
VRNARVFRALLGVDELVIERVDVEDGGEVLVVHARPTRAARGRCGVCRRRCGGYDAGEGRRRWRALDAGTARVFIEADCSRVRCRESARCGRGGGLRDDAVRNCSRAEYSFVRRLCGNRYGARARLQRDIAVRRGLLPGVPALTKAAASHAAPPGPPLHKFMSRDACKTTVDLFHSQLRARKFARTFVARRGGSRRDLIVPINPRRGHEPSGLRADAAPRPPRRPRRR